MTKTAILFRAGRQLGVVELPELLILELQVPHWEPSATTFTSRDDLSQVRVFYERFKLNARKPNSIPHALSYVSYNWNEAPFSLRKSL